MCSDIAIRVSHVSKTYKVTNDEERRKGGWRRLFRFGLQGDYVQALKDVSFEVKRGETLGIIGRNGAGKSTLLRVIAGITQPDSGSIEVNGVTAPVLALQSGFNVQKTGRENIYLKGAAMGIGRAEMDNRFDAIAGFADIGEFIEQPLRTYSNGMRARLAFAMAFHTDPEILIVDETLAVGDEVFRRKCFDRIASIKESGATTLFVTHGYHVLVQFCDRALLMERGQRLLVGDPKAVVDRFQELVYAPPDRRADVEAAIKDLDQNKSLVGRSLRDASRLASHDDQSRTDCFDPSLKSATCRELLSRGARIRAASIIDDRENPVNVLTNRNLYRISCSVAFTQPAGEPRLCVSIKTVEGLIVTEGCFAVQTEERHDVVPQGLQISQNLALKNVLRDGTYFLDIKVFGNLSYGEVLLHSITDAFVFRVATGQTSNERGAVQLLEMVEGEDTKTVSRAGAGKGIKTVMQ